MAMLRCLRAGPLAQSGRTGSLTSESRHGFHSSTELWSNRSRFLGGLKKKYGAEWPAKTLSSALLTESIQGLLSKQNIKTKNERAAPYRDALRDLAALTLTAKEVTMSDVEEVLNPENSVTWRAVGELLDGGVVKELRDMTDETRAACLFARVHGIGPIKATNLAKMGLRTLQDLEKQDLHKAQRIGLDHLDDMEQKIPRVEIDVFDALLKDCLRRADPEFSHAIMGSYRRGNICSSDIDMVVWHPTYTIRDDDSQVKGLMEKLKAVLWGNGILSDDKVMAKGIRKIMGLTRLPEHVPLLTPPPSPTSDGSPPADKQAVPLERRWRQIDIRLCPVPSLPYMLLGNTGDDSLMKILRNRAYERGWVLNEYGMGERVGDKTSTWVKEGTEILVKTEKEIFDKLEVPYLTPEQRNYATYEKLLGRRYLP